MGSQQRLPLPAWFKYEDGYRWRRENPERWKEIVNRADAKWRKNNPGKFEEAQRKSARKRHREMRIEVFELLGGAFCAHCGFRDPRALQIDHINGGEVYDNRTKQDVVFLLRWIQLHQDEAKNIIKCFARTVIGSNEIQSVNSLVLDKQN